MTAPRATAADDDKPENCPSCDESASWELSSRHRFSPFGSVLLAVLAFWAAAFSWLFGFGYQPATVLLTIAILSGIVTRKAEVCAACGYVRPKGG